jgi:cytochrome c oxidase cbb3-type subunit 3
MKKKILVTLCLLLAAAAASAQEQAANRTAAISDSGFYTLLALLILVIFFQTVIIRRLTILVRDQQYKLVHGREMPENETHLSKESPAARADVFTRLYRSLTRPNKAGKQKDVMLDHNYDGIRELDNIMPPWLQLILYGTILFAFVYLLVYHVYDAGKLPMQEYADQLQQAQEQKQLRLKLVGASVDENSVTLLTDAAALSNGKTIFIARCSPCHGQAGEGGVGPNLTDGYWIHGGRINEIFRIVKYGVPAKGMVPWQGVLKPEEMQMVSSFIQSLQGSNPPNGKAPQGTLYSPSAGSDTTTTRAAGDTVALKTI